MIFFFFFYCLHVKPLRVFRVQDSQPGLPTLISLWNLRPWERRSHTCSSCLPVYLLCAGRCMLAYHAVILSSWPFKRMRANVQQNPGREEASSESEGGMQAGRVPLLKTVHIRVGTMCWFWRCPEWRCTECYLLDLAVTGRMTFSNVWLVYLLYYKGIYN